MMPSVYPRMLYLPYKEGEEEGRSFLLLESYILKLLVTFK